MSRIRSVRLTLFERDRSGHRRLGVLVRIDVSRNFVVHAVSVACKCLEFCFVCDAVFACFDASVKHIDDKSDALRADFVCRGRIRCLVVVLTVVVDDCVCVVFAAGIRHVDAAEIPRYRHVDRCAVCKRDGESCREVCVISAEFFLTQFDVFSVNEFEGAVKIVLDITALVRCGRFIAIAAVAARSCKDTGVVVVSRLG